MDDTKVEPGMEIELIAISSGSVSRRNLGGAFEEGIDQVSSYSYRRGMRTVRFQRVPPNEESMQNTSETEVKKYVKGVTRRIAGKSTSPRFGDGENGEEYHFYTVLWIERKGDIAYRRAAGRVPKAVWDKNCSEPINVVLG
ncbi:unnamed protein product [Alternaria alternata]